MTDVQQAVPVAQEPMYLIRKNGMFYHPNAQGYTCDAAYAGRFTLSEAIRHSHPNGPDGPRDGIDYMPTDEPASLPCKSGEGARVVPVEQLREWYTAAWATWLETIGDADDDEDRPTPAHLNEMEALLSAPVPDATQTREAEGGPIAELIAMLSVAANEEGVTVFDHTPEEIGLHVMENYDEFLAALNARGGA